MVVLGAGVLLCVGAPAWAQSSDPSQSFGPSDNPAQFLHRPRRAATVKGNFKLVAIGDLLYSHPYANDPDPKLQQVFELIRSGDVTIGNKEGVFFD
ncbi:MAG: hypothetical protein ACREV7_19345, partial [Steroidobacteraceae bacterium]